MQVSAAVTALSQVIRSGMGSLGSSTGVFVALAVAFVSYALWPNATAHAVRHLPRPPSTLPVLYNAIDVMSTHSHRLHDWLFENCEAFGGKPWRLQVPGRPVSVVMCSVEAYEHILKTQFERFVKGEYTTSVLRDVLGDGIFNVDGDQWYRQRKTASHLFSLHAMREIMESAVREHCVHLCDALRAVATREKNVVELKRLMSLFSMDIFTQIGFGVSSGSLKQDTAGETEENDSFVQAFDRCSLALMYRFHQPMWLWRLKKWLNVGSERRLARDRAVIAESIHGIISQCMSSNGASHRNLVSLFLDKRVDEDGATRIDAQRIHDMAINFIAAGRETTAQAMTWVVLMLNRYPAVLDRVREELRSQLAGESIGEDAVLVPTMEQVHGLVYLEAVIKETLRLHPITAVTARTATTDTTLHDGTFIRAGTRVVLPTYALGRLEAVWGNDAKEFKPERWIEPSTGRLRQVSPFKFPAFHAGPRRCLGVRFSLMEMKITLAALLSRFDLRTQRDPFAFTYSLAMTTSIRGPLDVTVTLTSV
ncbi:hypothetical protein ATCC90586_000656 [Pythium insidiosum]|nr:hypothetical protein ATCC90586_000656 [Pythium insidiosum]